MAHLDNLSAGALFLLLELLVLLRALVFLVLLATLLAFATELGQGHVSKGHEGENHKDVEKNVREEDAEI